MNSTVKLRIRLGYRMFRELEIQLEESLPYLIGKGNPALGLQDSSVVEFHCFLTLQSESVHVFAAQGITLLDGMPIQESLVTPGMRLDLGDCEIEFLEVLGQSATSASPGIQPQPLPIHEREPTLTYMTKVKFYQIGDNDSGLHIVPYAGAMPNAERTVSKNLSKEELILRYVRSYSRMVFNYLSYYGPIVGGHLWDYSMRAYRWVQERPPDLEKSFRIFITFVAIALIIATLQKTQKPQNTISREHSLASSQPAYDIRSLGSSAGKGALSDFVDAAQIEKSKSVMSTLQARQLTWAAQVGDIILMRELIVNQGIPADLTYERGVTPLMTASYYGKIKAVQYLIKMRANLNALDKEGNSALMYAAGQGRYDVVRFLISKGAFRSIRRLDGQDATQIAKRAGYPQIARMINGTPVRGAPARGLASKR